MRNVCRIAIIVAIVSMLLLGIGFPYWTADTVTITATGRASTSAISDANGGLDASGNTTTKVDLVFEDVV